MKNSAKITISSGTAVEAKTAAGLFTCVLKHEVKATAAEFKWEGPKISREEWTKMLAFFKWTYDTDKSESQVRWYVHPESGWKCWAFPQRGGTGMTTKELNEHPDFAKQRAEQIPTGAVQWLTVHHHCSSGAFQSGTDHADEKGVEGIHITIGKMDKDVHDIHVRMYYKGHTFEPDMSHFWDVGEAVKAKADEMRTLFGVEPDLSIAAKMQMCQAAPKDHPFPEEWKRNYIVTRPAATTSAVLGYTGYYGGHGVGGHGFPDPSKKNPSKTKEKLSKRERKSIMAERMKRTPSEVLMDIFTISERAGRDPEDVAAIINNWEINNNWDIIRTILLELQDSNVTTEQLYKACPAVPNVEAFIAGQLPKDETPPVLDKQQQLEIEQEMEKYYGYGH